MANDMVRFGKSATEVALNNPAEMAAALQRAQAELGGGSRGGEAILRMDKAGTWIFGAEANEPGEDSLWAIHPFSLSHGWISWADGSPAGEMMVPITTPRPSLASLPEAPGDGWGEQFAVRMVCIRGEHKGTEVLFKGGSLGVRDAFADLTRNIAAQLGVAPDKPVPVVTLTTSSYLHKKYGRIYKPVLQVKYWAGMDDTEAEEVKEEEQPKRQRVRRGK
jgi:hypothetical protein